MKFNFNINKYKSIYLHPHHIIPFSWYPFLVSVFLSYNFLFLAFFFNSGFSFFYTSYLNFFYLNFFFLFITLFFWWSEMIEESIIFGHNTKIVNLNFFLGMVFFIFSEIMFFFGFFWAYFHFSLNPSVNIGACWPPYGILVIDSSNLPFLNTLILLSSGFTVTWSHVSLKVLDRMTQMFFYDLYKIKHLMYDVRIQLLLSLFITIVLSFIFLYIQFIEFKYTLFTISDSVYGSIFFCITGLHGFHVFIGTCFLIVSFFRFLFELVNYNKSSLFEFSVWYWHFVDIVWLFVMIFIYIWGN